MQPQTTKCWCGRPLHYKNQSDKKMVDGIVDRFGEFIKVTVEDGTTYKVQRHYIALHGIKEKNLKELGFDETEAN